MKKMLLLALAAMSARLALPAFSSATPAHLNENPGVFTVHGGAAGWSRTDGVTTTSTTTTGVGSFESTTTGTVKFTVHGKNSALLGSCGSTAEGHTEASGTVTTTTLPFHLVMLGASKPGILLTPGKTANGEPHFATYSCGSFFTATIVVKGNGILGEITSPACGVKSGTATLKFNGAGGVQTPQLYTGVNYSLSSKLGSGAFTQSAMNAEAKITFGGKTPSIVCT